MHVALTKYFLKSFITNQNMFWFSFTRKSDIYTTLGWPPGHMLHSTSRSMDKKWAGQCRSKFLLDNSIRDFFFLYYSISIPIINHCVENGTNCQLEIPDCFKKKSIMKLLKNRKTVPRDPNFQSGNQRQKKMATKKMSKRSVKIFLYYWENI